MNIDRKVIEQALAALEKPSNLVILSLSVNEAIRSLREALAQPQPVQQEQASRTNCGGCANADSWGLPDKAICKSCVGGNHWQPLNKSSVNPNTAQPVQQDQCQECDGTGTVARSQAHFPCPICTSPQAAQPLTKTQRAKVCIKAEAAMQRDPNLSWRDALMNETEKAHGITKGTT